MYGTGGFPPADTISLFPQQTLASNLQPPGQLSRAAAARGEPRTPMKRKDN